MVDKYHSCGQLRPVPDFPPPEPCPDCNGTGIKDTHKCSDCHDNDYFRHGQHEYECQECGGAGTVNIVFYCSNCKGCGILGQPVPVGEVFFSSLYLGLIADLPNAVIATSGMVTPAYFTFDGGDGLVMPRL